MGEKELSLKAACETSQDKFSLKEHQLGVEPKKGGVKNWFCMVNLMLYLVLGIIHVK